MPYYECPVCGGGYVIDPAPPHPKCDRDGAALKRASEASYDLAQRDDTVRLPAERPRRKTEKKSR